MTEVEGKVGTEERRGAVAYARVLARFYEVWARSN